jgi:hypothetical protein
VSEGAPFCRPNGPAVRCVACGRPLVELQCCSRTTEFGRAPPPLHESADRRPPGTMEDILKVFEDDLLTAVQSVIELLVGLIR